MNKKLLAIAALLTIFMGACAIHLIINSQDKGQEIYRFEAMPGKVTFLHWKHQTELKIDCVSCHHETEPGVKPKACNTCHKSGITIVPEGEPSTMKNAAHNLCLECHNEKAATGAKAPTKCLECHIKNS